MKAVLTVTINLDAIPGAMHTPKSAEKIIDDILKQALPNYFPEANLVGTLPDDYLQKVRVDDILAKNSKPLPICITCNNPILPEDEEIVTRHGSYHGGTYVCVDGRP